MVASLVLCPLAAAEGSEDAGACAALLVLAAGGSSVM